MGQRPPSSSGGASRPLAGAFDQQHHGGAYGFRQFGPRRDDAGQGVVIRWVAAYWTAYADTSSRKSFPEGNLRTGNSDS
jgi:hypothetical protein